MRVLIADDHSVVREGLKQILKKLDTAIFIDEAKNGDEAFNKMEKQDYDLVILDISMPGKSGLDILKELKDKKEKANIFNPKHSSSGAICNSCYEVRCIRIFK